MSRVKTAVLISGSGSNLQALIDASGDPQFPAEISLVISNRADAYGLKRAEAAGIETEIIDHRKFGGREEFDAIVDQRLHQAGIDIVCLAGFMRLLSPWFVSRWRDRVLNIHPSLLPAFPGLHVQRRAIEAGARFSGCTVHFVREETDSGPIIIQAAVAIHDNDTPESLAARILIQEHRIYPYALRLVAAGDITIRDDRVFTRHTSPPNESLVNPEPRVAQ